jgi:hypothetical protein
MFKFQNEILKPILSAMENHQLEFISSLFENCSRSVRRKTLHLRRLKLVQSFQLVMAVNMAFSVGHWAERLQTIKTINKKTGVFMKFIIAFLMLFSFAATAQQGGHVTISNPQVFPVTAVYTQWLPQNTNRNYVIIYNAGVNPICVGFGPFTNALNCIAIPSLGNYEPYKTPIDALYMISPGGTQNVVVWEGQ